jgi:hypothetical protein
LWLINGDGNDVGMYRGENELLSPFFFLFSFLAYVLFSSITYSTTSNQVTNDLWDAWGESSGLPVKEVMSTWTLQMGYPLLTVEEDGAGGLSVTQQRFLKDGAAEVSESERVVVEI